MGTLVRQCELGCLHDKNLVIDVVEYAGLCEAVDVIRVILQVIPRKHLEEGVQ